eukprot:g42613.t1
MQQLKFYLAQRKTPVVVVCQQQIILGKGGPSRQRRVFAENAAQEIWHVRKSLTNFNRCTIESILTGCIAAWYGNCSAQDRKKLLKVVCTAQTITKANLLLMDTVYTAHCCGKVANIIKDPSHP